MPGRAAGLEGVELNRPQAARPSRRRKNCDVVTIRKIAPCAARTYDDQPQTWAKPNLPSKPEFLSSCRSCYLNPDASSGAVSSRRGDLSMLRPALETWGQSVDDLRRPSI